MTALPQVRVNVDARRWAIRGPADAWWTVRTNTDESVPLLVDDTWFGPGWCDLLVATESPAGVR